MYSKTQLSIGLLFVAAFLSLALSREFNGPEIPTGPYELSYPANFGNRINIPEDRQLTKQEVYLGRMLFYETKLSLNNKISCATCHKQTLAFTDGKKFSAGVDGALTKRNSMSLTNLLWVRNFFWDGRSKSLEEQAKVPATDPHEMGQSLEASVKKLQHTGNYPAIFNKVYGTTSITGLQIVNAIAQFERTLISANSPYDKYLAEKYSPSDEELNGLKLFTTMPAPEKNIRGANCVHCHGMPKTFSEMFHNNGLDSIANDTGREQFTGQSIDRGRFRVPTLRNITLTAPYMHDGRFNTLEEVLNHYSEHIEQSSTVSPFVSKVSNTIGGKQLMLSEREKKNIIAFLNMLTDSTFINNPEFSNPHSRLNP